MNESVEDFLEKDVAELRVRFMQDFPMNEFIQDPWIFFFRTFSKQLIGSIADRLRMSFSEEVSERMSTEKEILIS